MHKQKMFLDHSFGIQTNQQTVFYYQNRESFNKQDLVGVLYAEEDREEDPDKNPL